MLYRIVSARGGFRLYKSPEKLDKRKVKSRYVPLKELQRGADRKGDVKLQRFFLAMEILAFGEKGQRHTVEQLTASGVRSFRTWLKRTAEYLEISRYPAVTKIVNYFKKRSEEEMSRLEELDKKIKTALAPIKDELRLPATNPSEFSYTVPPELVTEVKSEKCKNYLKSLVTHGPLTTVRFKRVIKVLNRDFPAQVEAISKAMMKTESRSHLSAVSFDDYKGQLLVSMVNINGDLLRMEGFKFLRLIDNHDKGGGWLSLGELDQKDEWLPPPLLTLNKERTGEIIARYSAADSSLQIQLNVVVDKKSGKKEAGAQALFILDQDYIVCLYIAVLRLKNDKARFEELRELAETKPVKMDDIQEELDDGQ